ncbi:MAG: zinc-ribbon domain-containing protein [Clostridia bacterium]|nr:zinc-ribbon domain-containing protein [Clostridia bacterium]
MFYCRNCKSQVTAGQAQCSVCGCDVVDNYEVVCSSCGTHNKGGSRFCATCGGLLPMIKKPICVICGTQNVPGAKFCSSCGAPMLMTEDTHTEQDIIEQRKQKMRGDLIEKERIQAVDEEVLRRRQRIAQEELKSRDIIAERERECDDYINRKAEKLERYKRMIEESDSPDTIKLKKLVNGVKSYSRFLSAPFSELSDKEKEEAVFICPVCGAENSLASKECYACGRNKVRSQKLAQKGKIVRVSNFGITNKKMVTPIDEIDISDVYRLSFKDITDETKPHAFEKHKGENQNAEKVAMQNSMPTYLQQPNAPQEAPRYSQNFVTAPYNPAYQTQGGQFQVAPSFQGCKPGEPYQMPPIVQPVAFVPYVTQDQPILQYAEGNEITNKNGGQK